MMKKILLLTTFFTIVSLLHARQPSTPALQQYEQILLQEENDAFNTFVNAHIDITKQKNLLNKINACIQATKKHYTDPKIKGTHNKKIPQNILTIIIAQLKKNNINSSGITIDVIEQKNTTSIYNGTIIATNSSPDLSCLPTSANLLSVPKISINLSLFKEISSEEIIYTIAHEIEHMIRFHSIKKALLMAEAKKTDSELLANNTWIAYLSTQEKSATILPSLYDKVIALATLTTFKGKATKSYPERSIHPKYKTVVHALTHIIASY